MCARTHLGGACPSLRRGRGRVEAGVQAVVVSRKAVDSGFEGEKNGDQVVDALGCKGE